MAESATVGVGLGRSLSVRHYFALGFGTIIGVGWIVYVGTWLDRAGPIGASLAFAVGALLLLPIGYCYACMAARLPVSGGEMAYAYEAFGPGASFAIGWMLSLCYISITAFEAISLGILSGLLLPALQGPVLYSVGGHPVTAAAVLAGLAGTVALTIVNLRSVGLSASSQIFMEWVFIGATTLFVVAAFSIGSPSNLRPLISAPGDFMGGFVAVLLTVPVFLAGFNVIPQLMEERSDRADLSKVSLSIVYSILAAAGFYIVVILAVSYVFPWTGLVDDPLPAAAAFERAFESPLLAKVVLFAATVGLVTTWNGVYLATSRMLYAMGRAGFIPRFFAATHETRHVPNITILIIAGLSAIGILLGRGAILPIVNLSAAIFGLAFLVTSVGAFRLRDEPGQLRIPGGVFTIWAGIAAAALFTTLAISGPFRSSSSRFPAEFFVLLTWGLLGVIFWYATRGRRALMSDEARHSLIVGEA